MSQQKQQTKEEQQKLLQKQDEHLQIAIDAMDQIKITALEMGTELDRQNSDLQQLVKKTDKTNVKLTRTNHRVSKLLSKDCCRKRDTMLMAIILVLFLIMITILLVSLIVLL